MDPQQRLLLEAVGELLLGASASGQSADGRGQIAGPASMPGGLTPGGKASLQPLLAPPLPPLQSGSVCSLPAGLPALPRLLGPATGAPPAPLSSAGSASRLLPAVLRVGLPPQLKPLLSPTPGVLLPLSVASAPPRSWMTLHSSEAEAAAAGAASRHGRPPPSTAAPPAAGAGSATAAIVGTPIEEAHLLPPLLSLPPQSMVAVLPPAASVAASTTATGLSIHLTGRGLVARLAAWSMLLKRSRLVVGEIRC